MDGLPNPLNKLAFEGSSIRSAPMPLVRRSWSFSMPVKMPTIDRIIMTSMATASTLMTERKGRCSRLAKISLFIFEPDSAPEQPQKSPISG